MKSKIIAYLLWLCGFIGLCGLHRLYLEKWPTGFLWLFTLGFLGLGQLYDLFTLAGQVDHYNQIHIYKNRIIAHKIANAEIKRRDY